MTPDEHYETAQEFAEAAWEETDSTHRTHLLQAAQVHATLATITQPPLGVVHR